MSTIVANFLEMVPATIKDYKKLAHLHYKPTPQGPNTAIYKIRAKSPYTDSLPDPVAIIVYRMPIVNVKARNRATRGYFQKPLNQSTRAKLVSQKIRYLSRIIVDSRFRRRGIATNLITESLKLQTVPLVETFTPIDFTNDMFTKVGFELHHSPAPPWYRRFDTALRQIGIEPDELNLASTLQHRLDALTKPQTTLIEFEIKQFLHHYRRLEKTPPGIERSKLILQKFAYPQSYLIWYNPKIPFSRKNRADTHMAIDTTSTHTPHTQQTQQKVATETT